MLSSHPNEFSHRDKGWKGKATFAFKINLSFLNELNIARFSFEGKWWKLQPRVTPPPILASPAHAPAKGYPSPAAQHRGFQYLQLQPRAPLPPLPRRPGAPHLTPSHSLLTAPIFHHPSFASPARYMELLLMALVERDGTFTRWRTLARGEWTKGHCQCRAECPC